MVVSLVVASVEVEVKIAGLAKYRVAKVIVVAIPRIAKMPKHQSKALLFLGSVLLGKWRVALFSGINLSVFSCILFGSIKNSHFN